MHGAAGKSTLLDILSLRKTSGKITGKVRRGLGTRSDSQPHSVPTRVFTSSLLT